MHPSTQSIAVPAQAAAAPPGVGELIAATIRAVVTMARSAHLRYRQHRQARAAYDALRRLDDHMLRDLGLDRSEVTSLAAEVAGVAEPTRVRALLASHGM